jgi:hypothetical protein
LQTTKGPQPNILMPEDLWEALPDVGSLPTVNLARPVSGTGQNSFYFTAGSQFRGPKTKPHPKSPHPNC